MNNVPPAKQEHPAGPAQDADLDLVRIVQAWPNLPEFIRQRILFLIEADPDAFVPTKKGLDRVRGAVLGYKTRHDWDNPVLQNLGITRFNCAARLVERLADNSVSVADVLRERWADPANEPKLLEHGSCGRYS